MGGYDPEEHLQFLSKHGVENMFTTPTALRAMTGVRDAGKRYPLERLRITCSAGEPLNPGVIRWFREQYGITVLDFYGLTESYPLCGNFPTVEVREGSMGLPLPGWDVAILDEDENPLPQGERGVIISAGYRIGPFEVESACVEHPAVKEAAAVASPDPRRGDIVKAFIVVASGREPSDELAEEIKLHVRERHSAYAYPREIEFVDDLPKTLTGKIRRVELRERERERKRADAPA